jgi:hypothetical protein
MLGKFIVGATFIAWTALSSGAGRGCQCEDLARRVDNQLASG